MKTPGLQMRAFPTEMDLTYQRRFESTHIPEAYESLIRDVMRGDHSNFVREDELDNAWKVGFLEVHCYLFMLTTLEYRSSLPSFTG